MSEKSLYERLGGVQAIATVVDDFLERSMRNPVTMANKHVAKAYAEYSPAALKYLVTEMVCDVTGGPQTYTGRTMVDSHDHLHISNDEFDVFAGDLVASMTLFGVPGGLQAEVLAVVETTRGDIVA